MSHSMDQGRGARRYATSQPLLVRCESWGEFVALYASDVSQGGMFIVTEDPPAVMSEVDVQLTLPEGHEIPLRARVVHVIDPAQAAYARREPGVGVEFVGLDANKRAQIHQLIEFARWQGTSREPTATLASHMFELNASAKPTAVRQTLTSAPPAAAPREAIPEGQAAGGESASSGVRRASSVPSEATRSSRSAQEPAPKRRTGSAPKMAAVEVPGAPPSSKPAAAPAPKPTDMERLKVGISHLAAKRFADAVKHLQAMLDDNPGDVEATKWLHVTHARKALAGGDEMAARASYEKVLAISEDVHEARKFVREHEHRKKLNALPFGRFFVKKK